MSILRGFGNFLEGLLRIFQVHIGLKLQVYRVHGLGHDFQGFGFDGGESLQGTWICRVTRVPIIILT